MVGNEFHRAGMTMRAGAATVAAMAGLHVLFAIAFLVSLISAGNALSAQGAHCSGENLVERLRRDDPGKFAVAMAKAERIENGQSVFWRVSKPGKPDSWLFGTMHSPDPRIAKLTGAVRDALESSDTVLIENVDALEPAKIASAMMKMRALTFLSEGETLDSLLDPERVSQLREAMQARNLPWKVGRHMQPWLVTAMIAMPSCELAQRESGAPVLDRMIAQEAQDLGKPVYGLETIEEQFSAVQGIPQSFHLNALADTLALGAVAQDLMETTRLLYLDGNTALILPLVAAYSPRTGSGPGYIEFRKLLLSNRNRVMAERAGKHLERGNAFLAVGAMHLPGRDGLVALLREAGYTVESASRRPPS